MHPANLDMNSKFFYERNRELIMSKDIAAFMRIKLILEELSESLWRIMFQLRQLGRYFTILKQEIILCHHNLLYKLGIRNTWQSEAYNTTDVTYINEDNNYGYTKLGELVRDNSGAIEDVVLRVESKIGFGGLIAVIPKMN